MVDGNVIINELILILMFIQKEFIHINRWLVDFYYNFLVLGYDFNYYWEFLVNFN
jgi:hypothetical protein